MEDTETTSRSAVTRWAVMGSLGIVAVLGVLGTLALLRSIGVLEPERSLVLNGGASVGLGSSDSELQAASGIVAAVFLTFAVVSAAITVGLTRWRGWAREAAMAIYGLGGAAMALISVAGLKQGGEAVNGTLGVAFGLGCLVVAGLVMHSTCADDFARHEMQKAYAERKLREAQRRSASAPTPPPR